MDIETGKRVRLTFAPGADVLPVFSPDYKKLMWTSTRDGRQPSQIYIADFTPPADSGLGSRPPERLCPGDRPFGSFRIYIKPIAD